MYNQLNLSLHSERSWKPISLQKHNHNSFLGLVPIFLSGDDQCNISGLMIKDSLLTGK